MKILVVGSGGREHALLWKLHKDAPDAQLFITRGNGGTNALATPLPLDPTDANALASWAEANQVDLTVVGPETALDNGIGDVFERRALPLFGPCKEAAGIETSKAYAKKLMQKAGVPTADFKTFTSYDDADAYIRKLNRPLVVKASGLAAGKGALVCDNAEQALSAAKAMMQDHLFGSAGNEVVIEERLIGEELSVLAITDGYDVAMLIPAQDHKRIGEGDTGANTGGMGVYAPVSIATPELLARVRKEVFLPTLEAMRKEDRTFRGVLYAGLMITDKGPQVIEFNARFGDPETQVVLPMLESSLLELILPVARGERMPEGVKARWREGAALTTVLASRGYPDAFETGKPITIPPHDSSVLVFHAGTKLVDNHVVTSGGRVLSVTALGSTLQDAADKSRQVAEQIQFENKYFRRDIGWRELKRA